MKRASEVPEVNREINELADRLLDFLGHRDSTIATNALARLTVRCLRAAEMTREDALAFLTRLVDQMDGWPRSH